MKKLTMLAAVAAVALTALSAVYQAGPARGIKHPDLQIVMRLDEVSGRWWDITEDAPLFRARFARVNHIEDWFNDAEARELAKAVAVAVARHLGSTNAVRVVRREVPPPASSNLVDRLEAALKAKEVTEEIVPF